MIPKVAPWKRSAVSDLESMLGSEGVLAVVDVHGIPASAMLSMRDGLRSDMRIRVAKKRLMRLAWENAGRDLDELEALLEGTVQPALVHSTTMDSFQIFRRLKETEEGRAAKPGDVAPFDIVIEKMDTGMPPGPIVGELNSVGIPAKIMGGSVQIQKRTVVLEEGEVFEGDLGMLLGQIGVKPIVTGLKLNGTLEEGVHFGPSSLDIDYDAFESSLIAWCGRLQSRMPHRMVHPGHDANTRRQGDGRGARCGHPSIGDQLDDDATPDRPCPWRRPRCRRATRFLSAR